MKNPETTQPILRFEQISKVYQTGTIAVEALKPTSFALFPSEMVAIMGPSGSGKSTLLSLAGALDHPTSGKAFVQGNDLSQLPRASIAKLRRNTIGYVFQDFNLMPGLTALENVSLPLELDGHETRKARSQAMESLERVNLGEMANRFPDNLSGGEQQRVAIARAFVGSRSLLLADEPTGALDTMTAEVVMRLLRKQCDEGRSALLVTHNPSHAAWADRIIFIKDGTVLEEQSSELQQAEAH